MRDLNFNDQPPRFKGKVITDQLAGSITRVEELAYIIRIDEVMTQTLITISPNASMSDVADVMREKHISGVLVTKDEELVGLVSTEDLIKCLINGELSAPVDKYMSTALVTLNSFDFQFYFLSGISCLLGKFFDFIGNNSKSLSCFTSAGRLDCCIKCK